jgi:hypothetical protein
LSRRERKFLFEQQYEGALDITRALLDCKHHGRRLLFKNNNGNIARAAHFFLDTMQIGPGSRAETRTAVLVDG